MIVNVDSIVQHVNVNMSAKNIVRANNIMVGILAHVFVRKLGI